MPLFRSSSALIYFSHIPKAGGTSVEKALDVAGVRTAMKIAKSKNLETGYSKSTPQHMHADVFTLYFPRDFVDYAFAVYRNPFGRIASEYKMKVTDGDERASPTDWITSAIERYHQFPYTRDNHIRPQVHFLTPDIEGFRLEDGLEKPIAAASKALGIKTPSKVPHRRKGSAGKLTITKATLDLISSFYRDDFETLGYGREEYDAYFDIQ